MKTITLNIGDVIEELAREKAEIIIGEFRYKAEQELQKEFDKLVRKFVLEIRNTISKDYKFIKIK